MKQSKAVFLICVILSYMNIIYGSYMISSLFIGYNNAGYVINIIIGIIILFHEIIVIEKYNKFYGTNV